MEQKELLIYDLLIITILQILAKDDFLINLDHLHLTLQMVFFELIYL